MAIAETDRYGNPIHHKSIRLNTYGKSSFQTKALIGDAVAKIIDLTILTQKPIIIEKLDFRKKKSTLKKLSYSKHSRMLASFVLTTQNISAFSKFCSHYF